MHPDPAPGPRGGERREMSFKRGLIKPENLCGTLTAVCFFAGPQIDQKSPGGNGLVAQKGIIGYKYIYYVIINY